MTVTSNLALSPEEQLVQQGFRPGVPEHLSEWSRSVDEGLCATMHCPACWDLGMEYRPFHNGQRYVALAVCPYCGCRAEL